MNKRIIGLCKDCAELRREIVLADDFEDGITVTLTGRELAAVVYSLALSYIGEWVNEQNGHRKLMEMIGDASQTLLMADVGPEIEKAINKILTDASASSDGPEGGLENNE